MVAQTQKMKLLYLMQILYERTDEQHIKTAGELCDILQAEYDVPAERKSIYTDIAALQEFGLDIVQLKGKRPGYFLGTRQFELSELKLLVDAVQASRSLTAKKTDELIRKLESLASHEEARQLQGQVFVYHRPKATNETIYYNVDKIHTAIYTNVQIRFQYTEWVRGATGPEMQPRRDGAFYVVSPWALTWDDENYYLIAYEEKEKGLRHYRVDKMQKMDLLTDARQGQELFDDFDLVAYAKKTFGMFGGYDAAVTLSCDNALLGVIVDRFGTDVMLVPERKNRFHVNVTVTVSPQFYGWLAGLGDGVTLTRPLWVREEFLEYLEGIRKQYEG